MIRKELISPRSIAVIGASEDVHKPGGALLANLLRSSFNGDIYVVNPKADTVQGIKSYHKAEDLPDVDLGILAIPAHLCEEAVRILCEDKHCGAIIIISAGFGENSAEGAQIEKNIIKIVRDHNASMIGPNCVGVMTPYYTGMFSQPVPKLDKMGIDFLSGSGATIVFILEAAMQLGLKFASVFSVGNSAVTDIEDILEYLDETYVHGQSSPVKMLYLESIKDPQKLLKHARSLYNKGARIVAIKSGRSAEGSRAASSHTGALASPDDAVDALFEKAGILRCFGREELVTAAAVLMYPKPAGRNIAIVTHAGGPAVMLTDTLSENKLSIPHIEGPKAEELLSKLYLGSSVGNPIDFLATGTAKQLDDILNACENDFDFIDAICVIFGCPGLNTVQDVYEVIYKHIQTSKKPIYPLLTSIHNAEKEIKYFQSLGGISFSEEVVFGKALGKYMNQLGATADYPEYRMDTKTIDRIIAENGDGYLAPADVKALLEAAGVECVKEYVIYSEDELKAKAEEVGFPMVMKVVGPVHKSDVGGVILNIKDLAQARESFGRIMKIQDATGALIQPMLKGFELYIGAHNEGAFGTMVLCGMGGTMVEMIADTSHALAPISREEADRMVSSLKCSKLFKGFRGAKPVNEDIFKERIMRIGALCAAYPQIAEMDLNPLLCDGDRILPIDARIRIKK